MNDNNDDGNKVYIENCTIFGRVCCSRCGSNTDLFHIEKRTKDMKHAWEEFNCKPCLQEIPNTPEEYSF